MAVPGGEEERDERTVELPVKLLQPGHVLKSDIEFENGGLALAAPAELSEIQVERLRNLTKMFRFKEPVTVVRCRTPVTDDEPKTRTGA